MELTRVFKVEEKEETQASPQPATPTQTPERENTATQLTPSPVPTLLRSESPELTEILRNEPIPMNDPIDLAQRLLGKEKIPAAVSEQPPLFNLGDELERPRLR